MAESSKNNSSEEDILVAAEKGELDHVKKLLESGVDPNTVDDIGTSALHIAAKEGHWDIARLLLEKKASPRLQDGHNATPLHRAIKPGHTKIVRLLLDCDPTLCESVTDPTRMLCLAASHGHLEIAQILLDHNVPTLDKAPQNTALHYAAKYGFPEVCNLLLEHDKALNRTLWERMTGPSLEVDTKDCNGATPLAYAFEKKHYRVVEVFLRHYPHLTKARDRHKNLFFLEAARNRDVEMVGIFLDHGADIDMKDDQGRRALHMAIWYFNLYDSDVDFDPTVETIKLLIDRGATRDVKNNFGRTPEALANNPKIRMLLRNYKVAKGGPVSTVPQESAPPPEYTK